MEVTMHIGKLIVFTLAITLAGTANAQATAGEPDWLSQAKIVAQMEGVSVGEAVRRAKLIQRAQKFAEKWKDDPDFAGGWIDRRNGGFKIVHAFRRGATKQIDDPELAGVSSFATVRYSLGEMRREIQRVGQILSAAGIEAVFSIDMEQNRVNLQTEEADKVRQLLSSGQLTLGDFVFIVQGSTKRRPEALVEGAGPTYGEFRDSSGALVANPCTAAFAVAGGGGRGISTAGHCNETVGRTQTHRDLPIGSLMDTRVYQNGLDAAWFRNTANTYTNRVRWTATSYYTITSVALTSGLYTSTPICVIKRDTSQQCAYFKRLAYYSGGSDGPYVQLDRDLTVGGDSGAPWLYGGQADGIHSGDSPPDASGVVYSEYTPADSLPRMSISVLTAL